MKLLTVSQAAELLSISESLVYALASADKLRPYRIGVGRGVLRFSEADVLAYLESCREPTREVRKPPRRHQLKHLKL